MNCRPLDTLTDSTLAFVLDLRRHRIMLDPDPRPTRAERHAQLDAVGWNSREATSLLRHWYVMRNVRARLRHQRRRVRVPRGFLWVTPSEWLTPQRWARLKRLAPELYDLHLPGEVVS